MKLHFAKFDVLPHDSVKGNWGTWHIDYLSLHSFKKLRHHLRSMWP